MSKIQTNFIPGPWRNQDQQIQARDMDGEYTIVITQILWSKETSQEDEATANLIAAAPDLYEELDKLLGHLVRMGLVIPASAFEALEKARGK